MTLGEQIHEARVGAGLTRAQVAHRLGTTEERAAAWERGERVPIAMLPAVACVLGATLRTETGGSLVTVAPLAPGGAALAFDED